MSFHDQISKEARAAVVELAVLRQQLPYYFRNARKDVESAEKGVNDKLSDNAGPGEWRSYVHAARLDTWKTAKAQKDHVEAFTEAFRRIEDTAEELLKAFDLQGRLILALCEHVGVNPDDVITQWMNDNGELGEKVVVVQSSPIPEVKPVPAVIEKPQTQTLPF